MSWAALFPGQGTQHEQMLPWLENEPASAPALQALCALVGKDWRDHLQDHQWRSRNAVAQPLLSAVAMAAWAPLAATLGAPAAVAGYSVGELPAFACAGLIDAHTAVHLAARRAALMDQAMGATPAGMISVAGLGATTVEAICERHGLESAILIGPTHRLLAGTEASIGTAWPALQAAGAELKRLEIRTASHTSWMRAAAEGFDQVLARLPFARPASLVVSNAAARASRDPGLLKRALSAQIALPVQWQACMQALAERQPGCVLEVGPGTSLARLWRQAHPQIPVRSLDDFQHWRAAAAWVVANG